MFTGRLETGKNQHFKRKKGGRRMKKQAESTQRAEQEADTNPEQLLTGAKEIAAFVGQETWVTLDWTHFYDFPMKRNGESVWISSVEKITAWLADRNLTIQTVNSDILKKKHIAEMEKNRPIDPKLSSKICRTLGEVATVFNLAPVTVIDCRNSYSDFPVKRGQGAFAIPASEFDAWFRKHPEVARRPA